MWGPSSHPWAGKQTPGWSGCQSSHRCLGIYDILAQFCAMNKLELRDLGAPSFLLLRALVDFRPNINSIPPQKQKAGLNAQNVIEDSGRQLLAPSFSTSCLSKHLPFLVIFHKHVLSDYCVLVTWSHVLSYPLILILLDPEVQTWTRCFNKSLLKCLRPR